MTTRTSRAGSESPPRPRCGGFTLLEVLLALGLMAVFAGLIIPALVTPVGTELRAAANRVGSVLRSTREAAVNTSASVSVRVDIESGSLSEGERTVTLPEDIALELFTARSELESDTVGRVRFFPDGSSTGGRITLSLAGRRYMVDVDWLTGRVTTFDPDQVEAGAVSERYEALR